MHKRLRESWKEQGSWRCLGSTRFLFPPWDSRRDNLKSSVNTAASVLVFSRVSQAKLCTIFSPKCYICRKNVLSWKLVQNPYLFLKRVLLLLTLAFYIPIPHAFSIGILKVTDFCQPLFTGQQHTHVYLTDPLDDYSDKSRAHPAVYKAELSKTASTFELLNSRLSFACAKIISTCKLCSYMCGCLIYENKLFKIVPPEN